MLGYLLALKITVANDGGQARTATLAEQVQEVTGSSVALSYVNQGYTGPAALEAAEQHSIRLQVVETTGGQARFRVAAQALGRGVELRLGSMLLPPGARLRATRNYSERFAFTRLSLTLCTLAKT